MKKTTTAMNTELRTTTVATIRELYGEDAVMTDSAAFDVPVVREDGTELYATVKVTLHKEDYDHEEAVANYELKVAEAARREADRIAKAEKKAADKAARDAKKSKKAEGETEGE